VLDEPVEGRLHVGRRASLAVALAPQPPLTDAVEAVGRIRVLAEVLQDSFADTVLRVARHWRVGKGNCRAASASEIHWRISVSSRDAVARAPHPAEARE